jgi:hypothetical protein
MNKDNDDFLILESLDLIKINTNNKEDLNDKINCFFDLEYWDKENTDINHNYDLFVTMINKYLRRIRKLIYEFYCAQYVSK